MTKNHWRIWTDTGGTFTDCLAVVPNGSIRRAKVLSSGRLRARVHERISSTVVRLDARWLAGFDPTGFHVCEIDGDASQICIESWDAGASRAMLTGEAPAGEIVELTTYEPAPILAARLVTGVGAGIELPPLTLRLGTTRGTNALLERATAPTAFFVTRGFADLLRIGDQRRPDLFALNIHKREPLHTMVIEVAGRLDAMGNVIEPLDLDRVRQDAKRALDAGVRSAAVALMHAWRNPEHEQAVGAVLREVGFEHVTCSAELTPTIKIVPRAEAAVADAALSPMIASFLDEIHASAPTAAVMVMTSTGGLVRADRFHPAQGLLSGPAGGVCGAWHAGQRSGFPRVISFDMGGTSTDAARIDGGYDYAPTHTVGGATLTTPALAIETVAAGGGSICGIESGRPYVGPKSAGATPGPACYGAGGPLTVTDVNLLLGRLAPDRFEIPLSIEAAREAAARSLGATNDAERDDLLEGFLEIANEAMAGAIRRISVRQGYDPAEYALVAFGGAGPQHACAVAELLDARTVIIPEDASLLSAWGLGLAAVERFAHRQVLRPLNDVQAELADMLSELEREASNELEADGAPGGEIHYARRIANVRYAGQDHAIPIEVDDPKAIADSFRRAHRAVFGHACDRSIELESARVLVQWRESPSLKESASHVKSPTEPTQQRLRVGGRWVSAPIYDRDALPPGFTVEGPALIAERRSVTVVEPSWRATIDDVGAIVLCAPEVSAPASESKRRTHHAVRAELLICRLNMIAEEMGAALQRTALSVNVKEREDYSCGVLDADGALVVVAPHQPVHLGALGACVRAVCGELELREGDLVATNHPAFGGSHLPDVTVVAPVYDAAGVLRAYVANRAHHAEIGGVRPGSMSPEATTLAEEGVVIAPMLLGTVNDVDLSEIERVLREAPYPSRSVEENLADVAAAVSSVRRGVEAMRSLIDHEGADDVDTVMKSVRDSASAAVTASLHQREGETRDANTTLDDGSVLRVKIDIHDGRARIDFSGSADMHPGNLNAPLAVVRSATLYVLRLLCQRDVPLNDGLMEPIELITPCGMLNPAFVSDPAKCPAVAAGNVETSQRIVNLLLEAFELAAGSQGTMNNVLMGDERGAYYETICGGSGATENSAGASAVHTHMTNTAITDPEVLEHRRPIRLERFAIRRGSGGQGKHCGGDGAVREFVFLEPQCVSLVTQHRTFGPDGLHGGGRGAAGVQTLRRADGTECILGSAVVLEVCAGDSLTIETPGGGGWGAPD